MFLEEAEPFKVLQTEGLRKQVGDSLLEATPQRKGPPEGWPVDHPPPIGQKQSQNCASRTKLVFPACPVWVAQQAARNSICQIGRAREGRRETADPRLYHSQRP